MANKSILVNDQEGGKAVACIDAHSIDDQGNSRIIQNFSNTVSPMGRPPSMSNPEEAIREIIYGEEGFTGDGTDLSNISAHITNNTIDVSDFSVLVVYVTISETNFDSTLGAYQLSPLALSDDGITLAFILGTTLLRVPTSKILTGDVPNGTIANEDAVENFFRINNGGTYCSLPMVFPTFGVKNVGFHVLHNYIGNLGTTLRVFGYGLTGQNADAALTQANFIENHGCSYMIPAGAFIPGDY